MNPTGSPVSMSPADIPSEGALSAQLGNFHRSLMLQGIETPKAPESWSEAFFILEKYLQEHHDGSRQLVFLDELPWLDTPRSGFVSAFEAFWNNWGCHRPDLMVIICGSATSWIQNNLINSHGGLYGRVTYEIKLSPFTLSECEMFLHERGIHLSRYDIAQSYMIVGGIPYYLGYFRSGYSLAQDVDTLFFSSGAKLSNEYDRLFSSIFSNPGLMKTIIELLYQRNAGYTRQEIADGLGMNNNGTLSRALSTLTASDFVIKYVPFGKKRIEDHYKLVDPFCMFYLRFVRKRNYLDSDFWQEHLTSQSVISWRGFAFEQICFTHIFQIKKALGISGVSSEQSAWSKRGDDENGAQIDLLIRRRDNVVNMCEIKYYSDDYSVSGDYYRVILRREELLRMELSPRMSIVSVLITTFGLNKNEYSGVFSKVITLDDLFS